MYAWRYHLANGHSAWVVNSKALPRTAPNGAPSEPRANGENAAREAYKLLGHNLQTNESIIATGAPHIRLGIDTVIPLIQASNGNVKPIGLSAASWEVHEPPITGVANVVSTHKADKRLRAALEGQDPNAPKLAAL